MNINKSLIKTTVCLLFSIFTASALAAPAPEAVALIEELDLKASGPPLSDNPAWNPKRIVINLPQSYSDQVPGIREKLIHAAGNVELVFNKSGSMLINAASMAGTDAVFGLCTAAQMKNSDRSLLWLHHYRAGLDGCTGLSASQLEQLIITNSKRLYGPTIAEHGIAMMLSLARNLPAFQRAQSEGKWQRGLVASLKFGEFDGKTMLVVGLGGIGSQIARRAHGLGMRVVATRNSSRVGPDYVDYVGLSDELGKLAAEADVIVNALPLTPKTTGLFDEAFFNGAKRGAIFISLGRGKSTVTADLIAALQSGQLYGAGLDVTEPEPLPADSPLWKMTNVIITPHISAHGPDSTRRSAILTVENLRRYVAGEALLNLVDIRAGY